MSATILAVQSDHQIQQDVLAELKWEPSIEPSEIGVAVHDGVVTLSGHVSSYYEKIAAAQTAKRVHGVKAMVNELDVKLPDDGRITDEDIAQQAIRALQWNILVPSKRIQVTVSKGWITLEGSVKWRFQKEAAEDAVRNLDGVVGVSNHIRISPRANPAELQASIEDAFKRSAELQARQITVQTDEGKVVLRGTVQSAAERQEAERQAWSAPGVREVENLLEVEP